MTHYLRIVLGFALLSLCFSQQTVGATGPSEPENPTADPALSAGQIPNAGFNSAGSGFGSLFGQEFPQGFIQQAVGSNPTKQDTLFGENPLGNILGGTYQLEPNMNVFSPFGSGNLGFNSFGSGLFQGFSTAQPGSFGFSGNQNGQPGNFGFIGNQNGQTHPGNFGFSGNQNGQTLPGNFGFFGNQNGQTHPGNFGFSGNQNGQTLPGNFGFYGNQNSQPGNFGFFGNQNDQNQANGGTQSGFSQSSPFLPNFGNQREFNANSGMANLMPFMQSLNTPGNVNGRTDSGFGNGPNGMGATGGYSGMMPGVPVTGYFGGMNIPSGSVGAANEPAQ